jgi:hypothetical protein
MFVATSSHRGPACHGTTGQSTGNTPITQRAPGTIFDQGRIIVAIAQPGIILALRMLTQRDHAITRADATAANTGSGCVSSGLPK